MSKPPVLPTPLTVLDRFWLDTARGAVKESIAALEGAAKQMIGITTLAQTTGAELRFPFH